MGDGIPRVGGKWTEEDMRSPHPKHFPRQKANGVIELKSSVAGFIWQMVMYEWVTSNENNNRGR